MKVNIIDDDNIIVFLFEEDNYKADTLKKVFKRLNNIYNMDIKGYYYIKVYKDKNYGIILSINKETANYFSYSDEVDAEIELVDSEFLYEIKDYFFLDKELKDKVNIYKYDNKLYLKINKSLSSKELLYIIENSKIIYDNSKIINKGRIV